MCMPHASAPLDTGSGRKEKKTHKSIPFNEKLMKPDPDFVDERKQEDEPKKSWLEKLLD